MADKLMGSKNSQWAQIGLSHPIASTFKTAQATARPKFLKELAKPTQERISIFFPTL
jgi:hypothetical protein